MTLYAPPIEKDNRLLENPPGILPASCVAEAVVHALTAKSPKRRYLIGPGPKKAVRLARMPARLRDWLVARFLGARVVRQPATFHETRRVMNHAQ